jgi:hypothetical protein
MSIKKYNYINKLQYLDLICCNIKMITGKRLID